MDASFRTQNNRAHAAIRIAPIFCWIGFVLGMLGATLVPVLIGLLFAISAIGLHKRKAWAGRLAIGLASVIGFIELVSFFVSTSSAAALGHALRLILCLLIIVAVIISWNALNMPANSNYQYRGTV